MIMENKISSSTIITILFLLNLFFLIPNKAFAAVTINTCSELQNISTGDTGDYLLGNDIDCSSIANFTPIQDFGGSFNGQNHTIDNLTINYPDTSYVGLFASSGQNFSISNLNIINVGISGADGTGCLVGSSPYGEGSVSINNVHCSGSVVGNTFNVGGLSGQLNLATITNSSFTGTVTAGDGSSVGGLVGLITAGTTITDSYFSGDTIGGMDVGGLIGNFSCWTESCSNLIDGSHSLGTISASSSNSGGLVGSNNPAITIDDSYSNSVINGDSNVGGLVGFFGIGSSLYQSYSSSSSVSGGFSVGGLIGFANENTTINQCFANVSSVSGSSQVGGLVGFLNNNSVLIDSYSTSNVNVTTSYGDLGGLIGLANIGTGNISRTYSSGTLSFGVDDINTVGGLTSKLMDGTLEDSFTVSKNSSSDYLSLIGATYPDQLPTIINSYDGLNTNTDNFSDYNFAVYDNWDFTDIWDNSTTYPILKWQNTSESDPEITPILDNIQDSNSGSESSQSFNSPGTPICTDSKPIKIPDLFQVNAFKNTAKLFFTPTDINQFYISFSTKPNAEENGELVTLAHEGVQSHTIYFLKPNTTYYIKVRNQNGCMPGDWSNIMKFTTNNSVYYEYFKKVLNLGNIQPENTSSLTKNIIKDNEEVITTPTPTQAEKPKTETSPTIDQNTTSKHCLLWWCW